MKNKKASNAGTLQNPKNNRGDVPDWVLKLILYLSLTIAVGAILWFAFKPSIA